MRCMTVDEVFKELEDAIAAMSPRELAQLRIEMRKTHGLPQQPEPDAWVN